MNEIANFSTGIPDIQEMNLLMQYCELLAKAPAYESMGGMPGVFALVMTARELGIGAMAALNGGMYLIPPGIDKNTGKPKGSATIMMAAKTMSMMIWKAGHTIEQIECNANTVTLKGTRANNGVSMTVTMTMQQAAIAGLSHDIYGKPKLWSTWFKNSEDMLWKTCVAKLGRRLFTDVIGNAYEPAEFEEKEGKEKLENKLPAKQLKGKNITQIETAPKIPQIELTVPSEELLQFIEDLGLDEASEETKQNKGLIEYVKENAVKRNKTYDEMLAYCYENKQAFLGAYETYLIKQKEQTENTQAVQEEIEPEELS